MAYHIVYLALGGNLGNRLENLRLARESLAPAVTRMEASKIYETPPWGFTDQPAFLNQVVRGETQLSPLELLTFLKGIETRLGRTATFRYGPRPIDMDILFYDDLVLEGDHLTLPHPRLAERGFVLVPLADLAPDLVHPVLGKTISELMQSVSRKGIAEYQVHPE